MWLRAPARMWLRAPARMWLRAPAAMWLRAPARFLALDRPARSLRSPPLCVVGGTMPNAPVRVAITGAAGQIGYSLVFRVASGSLLGPDQPVILHLLEIPPAMGSLNGVVMELEDCAFPLLAGVVPTDDPNVAFGDVNYALLVGSRPRTKGMERKELLEANGGIFTVQGQSLSDNAAS